MSSTPNLQRRVLRSLLLRLQENDRIRWTSFPGCLLLSARLLLLLCSAERFNARWLFGRKASYGSRPIETTRTVVSDNRCGGGHESYIPPVGLAAFCISKDNGKRVEPSSECRVSVFVRKSS